MPQWVDYILKGGSDVYLGVGSLLVTAGGAGWAVAHFLGKRHVELADRDRDLARQQRGVAEDRKNELEEELKKIRTTLGNVPEKIQRSKPPVLIECRGFFNKKSEIPFGAEHKIVEMSLSCQTIAFRNQGKDIDHLAASLDFRDDANQLVCDQYCVVAGRRADEHVPLHWGCPNQTPCCSR